MALITVRPPARTRRLRLIGRCLAVLSILLAIPILLAACDDVDQRAMRPGVVQTTPTPLASPEPADEQARGGAGIWTPNAAAVLPERQRIYFTHGGDLWQLPLDNLAAPVVWDRDILAFSPSPDGEQVATVLGPSGDDGARFVIVNADSTAAFDLDPAALLDTATAIPALQTVRAIAWSPAGSSIAVALQDGSISVVGIDGTVRELVPPDPGSIPGKLAWSPDDGAIAYLDPALPGHPASLYLVDVASGARSQLVAAEPDQSAVVTAAWLPGRAAIAYVLSSPGSVEGGGDVFVVDTATGSSQLLVPSGEFAPVAGTMVLAASPDGNHLALAVYVPGERHPLFRSLWVLDLTTRELERVETLQGEAVTDLWWPTARALVFRAIAAHEMSVAGLYTGTESFALYHYDVETGEVRERYRS